MTMLDYVGRFVRLRFDLTTRGDQAFVAGTVLRVVGHWRGGLTLGDSQPGRILIRRVSRNEVELLPDPPWSVCPCDRITSRVMVTIPADLAASGAEHRKRAAIDACVADLVSALAHAAIRTRASCCGHGKRPGEIVLQDGRRLLVEFPGRQMAYDQ